MTHIVRVESKIQTVRAWVMDPQRPDRPVGRRSAPTRSDVRRFVVSPRCGEAFPLRRRAFPGRSEVLAVDAGSPQTQAFEHGRVAVRLGEGPSARRRSEVERPSQRPTSAPRVWRAGGDSRPIPHAALQESGGSPANCARTVDQQTQSAGQAEITADRFDYFPSEVMDFDVFCARSNGHGLSCM